MPLVDKMLNSVGLQRVSPMGEISTIPDYNIKNANNFLKVPDEAQIDGEASSGIWLIHEYEEKDPHYAAQIESRKNALLSQAWDIVPASEDPLDIEAKDFVEWNLENLNGTVHSVFDAALDGISKGFSIAEKVWSPVTQGDWAGKVRIRTIKDKDQRYFRFKYDPFGNLLPKGIQQVSKWATPVGDGMPPEKFFIYTFNKRRDNWYGEGLGQKCAWFIYFKKVAVRSWNIFLQKFGNPTTIGKYPAGAPEAKIDDFLDSLKNLTSQTTITFPSGSEGNEWTVELLEAMRNSDGGYIDFIRYLDECISKRILGGTLVSDSGQRGARALGQIHQFNRIALAKFDALTLQDAFNEQVINPLVNFNFLGATPPRLEFRMISAMGRKEWLENLVLAQQIGMEIDKEWVHDILQIPVADPNSDTLEPRQNVRLGHRGNADTAKIERSQGVENQKEGGFLEKYQPKRQISEWERFADMDNLQVTLDMLLENGTTQATLMMKDVTNNTIDGLYQSHRRKKSLNPSINAAHIRETINALQMNSFCWGALTATENLSKLGIYFDSGRMAHFFEGEVSSTDHALMKPAQLNVLRAFNGKIPFTRTEYAEVSEKFSSDAYKIAGLTKNNLERIIFEEVEDGGNWSQLKTKIKNAIIGFTGSSGDYEIPQRSDAIQTSVLVRKKMIRAFNEGRLFVFKKAGHHLIGVQYSSVVGSHTPTNTLNDLKIYSEDSPVWKSLITEDHSDRSTVVAVPKTANVQIDNPPNLDVSHSLLESSG